MSGLFLDGNGVIEPSVTAKENQVNFSDFVGL